MNREISFFDYIQCFKHYIKYIEGLRQKKIQGETIVAKPVLLLSLIEAIDADVFINNQFVINDWLEEKYNVLMSKYVKESLFEYKTSIDKPFWHLETDGFWHLNNQGEHRNKSHTPSIAWLKKNISFAYFDESLWILLQNKEWRQKLRDFIIEHKLAVPSRAASKK